MKIRIPLAAVFVAFGLVFTPVGVACNLSRFVASMSIPGNGQDSASGLRHVAEEAIKAASANDRAKLLEIADAMVLPNPEEWFGRVFGDRVARDVGSQYRSQMAQIPNALAQDFTALVQQKLTSVEVTRLTDSCDAGLDENVFPILFARKNNEPLSWLQFGRAQDAKVLRYFAFAEGAFRFVGKLDRVPGLQDQEETVGAVPRISRDSKFIAARRIDHVVPIHPPDARMQHIQGTVKIHIIIGADGIVRDARVLSGPCLLAEAALRAVRQFQYSPSAVNGTPVEIDSTIEVVFSLGG